MVENKGSNVHYNKINITFPDWVIVENFIPRNMIISLGCAWDNINNPQDDIFVYHPIRKCNIYIITSPNENFEYGMHFCSVISNCCKPHKVVHHQTRCYVIYDGKLFLCPHHDNGQGIKCYHCPCVCTYIRMYVCQTTSAL